MPKIDRSDLDLLVAHCFDVLSGRLKDFRGLRIVLDVDHELVEKALLSMLSICAPYPVIPSDIHYMNVELERN